MEKVKLKSFKYILNEYANQQIEFPIIGLAKFDENSVLEVNEEILNVFLFATKDSFDFYEVSEKVDQNVGDEEKPDETKNELNGMIEAIKNADTNTLLALVSETGDKEFMEKAAAMTDAKIKKELLKRLSK